MIKIARRGSVAVVGFVALYGVAAAAVQHHGRAVVRGPVTGPVEPGRQPPTSGPGR